MKRRQFASGLGALSWSGAALAQAVPPPKHVGVLLPLFQGDPEGARDIAAFRDQLARGGWREGQNLKLSVYWAEGDARRMPEQARELAQLRPDIVLARSTPAARAMMRATDTIPIVFVVVSDPVGDGIVESLARPGRNVTGFTNAEASLASKWLQLLKQVAPSTREVACLFNPDVAPGGGTYYQRLLEAAAPRVGVEVVQAAVRDAQLLPQQIASIAARPNAAMVVTPDPTTSSSWRMIVSEAARHRLPAMYTFPSIAAGGGLISYGVDVTDLHRRAALYVDRILRGARPADLPVQLPEKFQLAVNLGTARAMGLVVPPSVSATADEVIE